MKFLQVVTLSAILVEYVTASDDSGAKFYYAVKKGILATAVKLYEQDKSLGKVGIDYVVEESNSKFIAKFINQTGQASDRTLSKLCNERPVGVIRKVLRKVDFPQKDLVNETAYHASQCHIEKVLVLLNKIKTPERQESVVESSIGHVLDRCPTDDFYSFLNALKRKSLLSERLENGAIRRTFKEGVKRNREDLLERTFNHPAITPEIYADGLIAYGKYEKHLVFFQWLLERADEDDLIAVRGWNGYKNMRPEFHAAINEALKTAQPGGTRIRDIQTVEKARETFEELGYFRESEEPVDLISAYIGLDKPTPRRKAKEAANWINLREVIDRRELETAVVLYKRDRLLHHKGIDYVIENQFLEFIVSFIRHAYETNSHILNTLCRKGSRETIEKILEKVNFSQRDLIGVASSQELMCEPEKFIVLINRIREPESQESVVTNGINTLIPEKSIEFINPLLDALKDKTFRSERLEVIAIRTVFKEGVKFNREDLLKRTFEHPTITPEIYADALIVTGKHLWSHKLTREWLLERADRIDLQAVQGRNTYKDMKPEFHAAINEALKTAQPDGTRTHDIQRVEMVEETFEGLGLSGVSEDLTKLISAYLGVDTPTPRRKAKEAAKEAANWIKLRTIIDEGELETAVVMYKRDKLLHHKGIEYVIEQQFPDFIASFAKHAYKMNGYILNALCMRGSKESIESVLEKVNFSQNDLIVVASEGNVVWHPPKFLMLLNKITTPEGQESVITNGINTLIREKSTEYINPMLDVLKNKTFQSERLEAIAIQMAFKEGVESAREDLLKRTFDHPAITPGLYADALIVTEKRWESSKLTRDWLLERADRIDLQEVQGRNTYKDMMPEFHTAIENALKTAQPSGTRTHDIQRVEMVEETFEGLGLSGVSEDLTKLISAYLGVDTPTPRRKAKEAAKEAANWIKLRTIIDEGELETAVVMYKRDKLLHHKGIEYVIEKQFPEFIVSFAKHAYKMNGYILNALCMRGSKETVENVLEKVDFSQNDLIEVASSPGLICEPEKFIVLINKIREPESQESVVEKNIRQLILHSRFGHLIPLLDALKDKTFRSERLEVIAIRIVFKEGVKFNREDLLKRTFEHPAITPELYADALIESEKSWEFSKLTREWLLKGADRADLQAVNGNDGYADLILPFRDAIENAWGIAKPGGTRTRAYDIQSAKKTREEFMKIEHAVAAISGIAKIIEEYLTGKEDEEREVEGVLQEQEEDVEMGVVDEEEWGEGEEAELGGGEDEEEEWGSI